MFLWIGPIAAFKKHVYRTNQKFKLKKDLLLRFRSTAIGPTKKKIVDLRWCLESTVIGNYRKEKKKKKPSITALGKRNNTSWFDLDLLRRLESATISTS